MPVCFTHEQASLMPVTMHQKHTSLRIILKTSPRWHHQQKGAKHIIARSKNKVNR